MDFLEKLNNASRGVTHLFSMGQAGYIIKNKQGETLGIDLYLTECVEPVEGHDGYHRLLPQIVNAKDLKLDIIIATHFHRDHFDIDAMFDLMANGKTHLFCACDCRKDVKQLGIDERRVTYVKPGDHYVAGNFDIHFIHSDHGEGAPEEVGILLTVDGKNILEVGDTSLHLDWKEEYLSAGPIDVLIAPINGAYGNLNEQEATELAKCLQPGITIPSHFGMFPSHGGNSGLFIEKMRNEKLPYKILTMGEDWNIE
ncbi:MBL fold metallo-hydrolase [Parabacteroides sp. AM58-2XD]|uniref:MBL fold metallo-hydrolase n=1 Tax=Parabacteroides TaxID=375288 RepID=UPI000FE18BB9|nr:MULTISPECIES: MBL fold metallo-hydrolase [Parabacteroides]MCM0722127.1 MBL fold metallo-hydrolase [Parabacteroides sp. W1-Q-101]RGY91355.1 MBL fold metallo-hydrolase [Parabacteroides sp. AM58-2XD]GKG75524.1 hypothetical protein CE91St1_46670 [Parabacteroides goldsteinii]GKG81069.1 hypothetical protein CE91St2_42610 [Parabacteroides goldsteinii]